MVSTPQVRLFLQIIDERGLTNAARAIGVSQPTLSSSLGRLERDLGVRLFDRRAQGLVLTATGRIIEHLARQIVAGQDNLEDLAAALREGKAGRLAIAVSSADANSVVLPRFLARFLQTVGDSQIRIVNEVSSARIAERVLLGEVDLGVMEGKSRVEGLDHITLATQPNALMLPARLAHASTIDELRQGPPLPLIKVRGAVDESKQLSQLGVRSRTVVLDATPALVPGLVLAGVGAAVFTRSLGRVLTGIGCRVVSLGEDGQRITLLSQSASSNPLVSSFVDCARAVVAEDSPWPSGPQEPAALSPNS